MAEDKNKNLDKKPMELSPDDHELNQIPSASEGNSSEISTVESGIELRTVENTMEDYFLRTF